MRRVSRIFGTLFAGAESADGPGIIPFSGVLRFLPLHVSEFGIADINGITIIVERHMIAAHDELHRKYTEKIEVKSLKCLPTFSIIYDEPLAPK